MTEKRKSKNKDVRDYIKVLANKYNDLAFKYGKLHDINAIYFINKFGSKDVVYGSISFKDGWAGIESYKICSNDNDKYYPIPDRTFYVKEKDIISYENLQQRSISFDMFNIMQQHRIYSNRFEEDDTFRDGGNK